MKQLVIVDKGNVRMEEVPVPEIDDEGILVKVARAAICGSDVHGYTKGPRYGGLKACCKFGHEMVGTIVKAGKNVKNLNVGDRVWVDPASCVQSAAESCRAGGFAEYVASLRPVKDQTIFVLPDDMSFDLAALIEPSGVGVHTKNRSGADENKNVLIYGAGPIAMICWASLKHRGSERVVMSETMPVRVDEARSFGAEVVNSRECDLTQYLVDRFGMANINGYERPNVDVYIDCAGVGVLMGDYINSGRPGSVFCTLGIDGTPLQITPSQFMSKELTVKGSRGYTPDDIREVIEVLMDKEINIGRIVTGIYDFNDFQAAFDRASDRNSGMKTVIKISDEN